MMRNSPLQLKDLFFPVVSVRALVPKDKANARLNFETDDLNIVFDYELSEDDNTANAGLRINTAEASKSNGQIFYEIDIEVVARYDVVSPEYKDDKATYLRKFAAASALIGAAREQVSLMTARGPWGTSHLPMITIDQVIPRPKPAPSAPEEKARPSRSKKKIAPPDKP